MIETKEIPINTTASSTKMLRAMVGIGLLCALLIVVTYEGTLPRIERLKAEALEKAIFKVIPEITTTKTFQLGHDNVFTDVIDEDKSKPLVYAGYDSDNTLLGIAITASGQGYADILRILYGYNPKTQQIVGFYVLESKETPGLGDKIEKDPNFLANFTALDVALTDNYSTIKNIAVTVKSGTKKNPWEIDGITGATISSRAIGDIISSSTQAIIPIIYKQQEVFMINTNNE